MRFIKMHGIGNDYVYVDLFQESVPEEAMPELARRMSDRHFGVGSDGLIFIAPATTDAPVRMRMFNADGSESEMCGNGLRCVAKYAFEAGIVSELTFPIQTGAGDLVVVCTPHADDASKIALVRVDMGEPRLLNEAIPTQGAAGQQSVAVPVEVDGETVIVSSVSMGNPHCVVYVEDVHDAPVTTLGPQLETHPYFPNGTNVEFIRVVDASHIEQRTWERGAGETLACGTGACGAVVAGVLNGRHDRKVTVKLLGGELQVHWHPGNNHVFMTGPAEEVFRGEWPL